MNQVRFEPAAPRSPVKHSTTEPLRSLIHMLLENGFTKKLSGHCLFYNMLTWSRDLKLVFCHLQFAILGKECELNEKSQKAMLIRYPRTVRVSEKHGKL